MRLVTCDDIHRLVIGNIGRYLNHSCEPNLEMVTIRSSSMVPHLALFTNRDVAEVRLVKCEIFILRHLLGRGAML